MRGIVSSKAFWISFMIFECLYVFNISAGLSSVELIKVFAAVTLGAWFSAWIAGGIVHFFARQYRQR